MDSAGDFSAGFPLTGSLYFCSVCGKPFDNESSHRRHLQYCRRRAARQQPARSRACQPCSQSKNKCDFKSPCSRCATRGFLCSYGKDYLLSSHSATAEPFNVGGAVENIPSGPIASELETLSSWELGMQPPIPDDSLGYSTSLTYTTPTVDDTYLTFPSGKDLVPSWFNDSGFLQIPEGSFEVVSEKGNWLQQPEAGPHATPRALFANTILSKVDQCPPCSFPAGSRQQILSLMRAYPRMVNQPNNLPHHIHPLGCGRHFDPRDTETVDRPGLATFTPLPALAACMSISQVFLTRNTATEEFLWRTIENERREIAEKVDSLSPGETLVAIQSIVIYVIMRLIVSGAAYMNTHREMIITMRRLSDHFCRICPRPFSPSHRRATRPSWEEWIFEETRRRVSTTCFLLALAIDTQHCDRIVDPHLAPLPGSKAMWEARSRLEWEHGYDAYLADRQGACLRLETMGDLALAKMGNREGRLATFETDSGQVDDALDSWYAGADGLGLVLATVVAVV